MKYLLMTITFVTGMILLSSFTWVQKASCPSGPRYSPYSFSIGNKGYVGGGVFGAGSGIPQYFNDLWEYDAVADTWTQMSSMPGAGRYSTASFSINGKGYVTTGALSSGYTNQTWEFDPASNQWNQKAGFPGTGRFTTTSFAIGSDGYVGMGKTSGYFSDFYKYDAITNTWSSIAAIPGPLRQSAAGFSIDGSGYVLCGANEQNSYNSNEFWKYIPSSNSWTQMTNYPGNASYALASFVINNIAFAGCGARTNSGNNAVFNDFYRYDPVANSWTQMPSFSGGIRNTGASMTIGNKGYLGFGATNIPLPYNFMSDWWTFEDQSSTLTEVKPQSVSIFLSGAYIEIYSELPFKSDTEFLLTNIKGSVITRVPIKQGSVQQSIPTHNLSDGVYLYAIPSLSAPVNGKISILRN